MQTMTKIIIALFFTVLILHCTTALLTHITISSGRFSEANPTTATLQFTYGLTTGLAITLIQGTALSIIPLMTYLGTDKLSQSSKLKISATQNSTTLVKYFFFPLALFTLTYLALIAGADVIHDAAMFLSNGSINTWTF